MPDRPRRVDVALVLLCAAQFLVVLDTTIVTVALPLVGSDLGFGDAGGLQYVISLYAVAFGVALLPAGRAADVLGRRRTLVAGLVVFTVASAACGLAWSPAGLIVARVVQGVGAAATSSAALALLLATFGGARRSRALGAWSAAGGAAGASGLLLGGLMTGWTGWRSVFLLAVPVGMWAVSGVVRVLPESRGPRRGTGAAGILARAVAPANVAVLVLAGVVASALFFTTLYVQRELGLGPVATGLAFLPNSALVLAGSVVSARLLPRVGDRVLLGAGLAVTGLGSLLLGLLTAPGGSYPVAVLPGFGLSGFGLGVAFVAATASGTALSTSDAKPSAEEAGSSAATATRKGGSDRDADHGTASGLVNTAQQIGFAVGLAGTAAVASAVTGAVPGPAAVVSGYAAGHLVAGTVAVLAAVTMAALPRRRRAAGTPAAGRA